MINYSIVMRSVNANLIEINQAKSRQAAVIKAIKEGKTNVDLNVPINPDGGGDGDGTSCM